MKLKIAILGTRGIPNHYGGYEQAVTWLAPGLVQRGHEVTVYNSETHPYRGKEWNGVQIVHCKDPVNLMGAAGQFVYDWHCLRHAGKNDFDAILMMGYTSSSVWRRIYPRHATIISNMDGLEWKRSKYSGPVQGFLQYAEKLAVKYSDHHIADSPAISAYLEQKYGIHPDYIPYGACIRHDFDEEKLKTNGLTRDGYFLLIARMEPENNIETILDGYCGSGTEKTFVVIGNTQTSYGKKWRRKYASHAGIRFLGAEYDQEVLNTLRHYCSIYFHGHSVGGTNPSLLEAMACGAMIAAHDNPFNKAVTGKNASYFSNANDVALIMNNMRPNETMMAQNLEKIRTTYNWEMIIDRYETVIRQAIINRKK